MQKATWLPQTKPVLVAYSLEPKNADQAQSD